MSKSTRLARVRISYEVLGELLKGWELSSVTSNLPKDATIQTLETAWGYHGMVDIIMESREFSVVPEGHIIPAFSLEWTKVTALQDLLEVLDR